MRSTFFRVIGVVIVVLFLLVALTVSTLKAGSITLTDMNSSVTIDPTTQAGISSWIVDGKNHLLQQWFWFSFEPSLGLLPKITEKSLDTFELVSQELLSPSEAVFSYKTPDTLIIDLTISLTGGESRSGNSTLRKDIQFTLLERPPPPVEIKEVVNFVEYSHFDLMGTPGNDTRSTNNQSDTTAPVNVFLRGRSEGQRSVLATDFGQFSNILPFLNDDDPTFLRDLNPPTPVPSVTGDVEFATQYRIGSIDPLPTGEPRQFTIVHQIFRPVPVPEPSTLLLLASGLTGLAAWRRKKAA